MMPAAKPDSVKTVAVTTKGTGPDRAAACALRNSALMKASSNSRDGLISTDLWESGDYPLSDAERVIQGSEMRQYEIIESCAALRRPGRPVIDRGSPRKDHHTLAD